MNLSIIILIMTIMVGVIATITAISSSGTIPNEAEANASDEYEHVICENHVWYPEGTDCKVALQKYKKEWNIKDDDQQEEVTKQKSMCEVDYEAKWKDGSCHFSGNEKEKDFDEWEYLMDLKDEGVYDDYLDRNDFIKEKHIKELANSKYNDDVDRETADYYCDASEDYVKNKKQCDKLYDKVEKLEEQQQPVIEDWKNEVTTEEPLKQK